MGAAMHTVGSTHHWIRFNNESQATYLGTAETAPEVIFEPAEEPIQNELSGSVLPFQVVELGQSATYQCVLNRFDFGLWKRVRDQVNHGAILSAHGGEDRLARGSLKLGYSTFELLTLHEFTGGLGARHPQSQSDDPVGRIFFYSRVAGYREVKQGTKVMAIAVVFRCEAFYDPATRGFECFSEDPGDFGPYQNPN